MPIKSEETFRFLNLRPVQEVSLARSRRMFARYSGGVSPLHAMIVSLASSGTTTPRAQTRARGASPFAEQTSEEPRQAALTMARRILAGRGEPGAAALDRLARAVGRAAETETVAAAKERIRADLGSDPRAFLSSDEGRGLYDSIWDRFYAHALAPGEAPEAREAAFAAVRHLHFIERLTDEPEAAAPMRRHELDQVTPLLPKDLAAPQSRQDTAAAGPQAAEEDVFRRIEAVHGEMAALDAAIADIARNEQQYRRALSRPALSIAERRPVPAGDPDAPKDGAPIRDLPSLPDMLAPEPWLLGDFGRKHLAKATLALIEAPRGAAAPEAYAALAMLEERKYRLVSDYVHGLPPAELGLVRQSPQFASLVRSVPVPRVVALRTGGTPIQVVRGSPAARGLRPLGMGDLFVVRQELQYYSAREVAHIENVLKSEFHTRTHTRTTETEEIVITETERMEETEKDLQSTERFELQKEVQKTIDDKMSIEAGATAAGSYGTTSITAHADFALSNATTEANRAASSFAREITERTTSKIMTRTRELRNRRTLERIVDKTKHGFDNRRGWRHAIGIYRWVDKYYKARLINYGRRLMFEFIIPEPAAFFRHLEADGPLTGITATKPYAPAIWDTSAMRPLKPGDIHGWNYRDFVATYRVDGVLPPPAGEIRVSAAFADAVAANAVLAKASEKLVVPADYRCYQVYGSVHADGWGSANYFTKFAVAGQDWGAWPLGQYVEGILPITFIGYMGGYTVNLTAICHLTTEAYSKWQLKTYQSIVEAYETRLAEYNEQVSLAEMQRGAAIQGRNPELNRKIERDELKKGALRLLTDNLAQTEIAGNWRYDEHFDATYDNGEYGYPEFSPSEAIAEGAIIQYFEQAFEWQNMSYRFYPYFWGRKDNWSEVFPRFDMDPQFTDFLRAGAARVIVPAHPQYGASLLHYMATSRIWDGGPTPGIDHPLYISIIDELKADADADLDDSLPSCSATSGCPCVAEEWMVRLPTTLVYLQRDDRLPDFR